MINGIVKIAARFWGQFFPERHIYLRSQGRLRYLTLPSSVQFASGALLALLFLWTTYASVTLAFHQGALDSRDARINELQANYDRLSRDLAQVQQRFVTATLNETNRQKQLAVAVTPPGAAVSTASELAGDVIAESQKSLKPDILPRQRPIGGGVDSTGAFSEVMPRERPKRPAFSLPESMTDLGGRNYAQTPSEPRLSGTTKRLNDNDIVAYLAGDAITAIASLEKLISLTGLDADTMLRRRNDLAANGATAKGGPLLSLPPSMTGKFLRRNLPGELAMPSTRKGRLEMLREALFSLPLAEPVEKYYISSGYGYRRDPFTHAKAFHSGMDLVAPMGDPVRSSAPGTVIFAGRNGPYGNMVEIDHGRGVKSRYGHLSKIAVTRGQKIGLRDLIGLVGNTGRSGTAHLHFEVWFDGKARDPRNFLKAGENVFQRQG